MRPLHGQGAIDSSGVRRLQGGEAGAGANEFVTKLIDQYLVESTSRMAELKDAWSAAMRPP